MSLRNRFMVKQVYGDTAFSLEAPAGRSLLVRDILCYNPAASYITVKVGKTTVGYFRVGGNLGNQLPLPKGAANHSHGITVAAADGALTEDHAVQDALGVSNAHLAVYSDRAALTTEPLAFDYAAIPGVGYKSLLNFLGARGLFEGFPIAEGQTMVITGQQQALCLIMVVYEEYDATDITATMANGSEATDYMFVNYGRTAAVIATTTSTIYSVPQSPAEFPDFPFGKDVPARYRIALAGILASDIADDRGSADSMTSTYLKLIRERETLFDSDKNGLFHYGLSLGTDAAAQIAHGLSLLGNLSDVDLKPPLMFPEPIVFEPGEELGVYLSTVAGTSQSASSLAVADTEVGLIMRVTRV